MQAELAALRGDNERLKARLDESQQQLQSNEQMIRWLNQQVTEAQLGATAALPGSSRYTFRPSSTLATPAAGLLPAACGASSAYPSRWGGPRVPLRAGAGPTSQQTGPAAELPLLHPLQVHDAGAGQWRQRAQDLGIPHLQLHAADRQDQRGAGGVGGGGRGAGGAAPVARQAGAQLQHHHVVHVGSRSGAVNGWVWTGGRMGTGGWRRAAW